MKMNIKMEILKVFNLEFNWETEKKQKVAETSEIVVSQENPALPEPQGETK